MNKNVYNVVWADDEIDDLYDELTEQELADEGIKIVGTAHDGRELERLLEQPNLIDAIIVDANFNETDKPIESERDKSGLDYARNLYLMRLNKSIPMFIYSNRTEEMLRDIYKDNPAFLEDFPRHIRWFIKSSAEETKEMYKAIKAAVDERNSTSFIVRNRFREELNAASLNDVTEKFVFEFLIRDYEHTLSEMDEPFIKVRRALEKAFSICKEWCIIPPVSNDMNGTANYFVRKEYSRKESDIYIKEYDMLGRNIMPKPLARSLKYVVEIVQDGAHSKDGLKLEVDKYFMNTRDILLLRSVVNVLMDFLKWFALTILNHKDIEKNKKTLWKKVNS